VQKACRTRIQLIVIATIAVAALFPALLQAQEDGDTPLGDVARSFRKKNPSSQEVIDNDNLSKVMDDVESRHLSAASLRYSIDAGGKSFQVSAPDVTCSLAFSANTKALLASRYVQVDLPADELLKLDGPATIDGDALQVSVFNGTDWHVSEVAVALTLLKRTDEPDAVSDHGAAKLIPAVAGDASHVPESRPEKRSDVTVLYRMRAAAAPSATTVFRAPLNIEIAPDQEWHWAIVQARGYPPQQANGRILPTQDPIQSALSPAPELPHQTSAVTPDPTYPSGTGASENSPPSPR
jgi:hypothetical protein